MIELITVDGNDMESTTDSILGLILSRKEANSYKVSDKTHEVVTRYLRNGYIYNPKGTYFALRNSNGELCNFNLVDTCVEKDIVVIRYEDGRGERMSLNHLCDVIEIFSMTSSYYTYGYE